jgi:hypothetical protein
MSSKVKNLERNPRAVSTTASNRRERRKEQRNIAKDVAPHRARVAALARGVRSPNAPEVVEARKLMHKAQQTTAAHAVLDATGARNSGDPDRMAEILRSAGVPIGVMLLESVELLAYLVRLSDRPDEMLAALHERITTASSTD